MLTAWAISIILGNLLWIGAFITDENPDATIDRLLPDTSESNRPYMLFVLFLTWVLFWPLWVIIYVVSKK